MEFEAAGAGDEGGACAPPKLGGANDVASFEGNAGDGPSAAAVLADAPNTKVLWLVPITTVGEVDSTFKIYAHCFRPSA